MQMHPALTSCLQVLPWNQSPGKKCGAPKPEKLKSVNAQSQKAYSAPSNDASYAYPVFVSIQHQVDFGLKVIVSAGGILFNLIRFQHVREEVHVFLSYNNSAVVVFCTNM